MSAIKCLNCGFVMEVKPSDCPSCGIVLSASMVLPLIKADEKEQAANPNTGTPTCWNCDAHCHPQAEECGNCGMSDPLQPPFTENRIRNLDSSKTQTQWPQKRSTK